MTVMMMFVCREIVVVDEAPSLHNKRKSILAIIFYELLFCFCSLLDLAAARCLFYVRSTQGDESTILTDFFFCVLLVVKLFRGTAGVVEKKQL